MNGNGSASADGLRRRLQQPSLQSEESNTRRALIPASKISSYPATRSWASETLDEPRGTSIVAITTGSPVAKGALGLGKRIFTKPGQMKFAKLGSSDIVVPNICMGTMTFGEQNTEEEGHALMDYCMERGVNFFDTAEMYSVPPASKTAGRSEEIVGTWLKKQDRREVIIATKVSGYSASHWIPGNRVVPRDMELKDCRLDRESIRAACEASLRRLQTDYIDLYQLHWPDRYVPIFGATAYDPEKERPSSVPIEETVAALGELIKEGKIKTYGLSNESTFGVCQFCMAADKLGVPRPVSIQNSFAPVHRSFETELAEACAPSNYNIGLLPWSPLAGGMLSGKYAGGKQPKKARLTLFKRFQDRYFTPAVHTAVDKYVAIAEKAAVTPSQLALAWCASRWYVASTIIGATTMEQCKENIDAFEMVLSEETLKAMDAVHLEQKDPAMLL